MLWVCWLVLVCPVVSVGGGGEPEGVDGRDPHHVLDAVGQARDLTARVGDGCRVAGGHGEYAIEAASRGLDVTMIDLPAVIGSVREWPRVRESGIDLVEGDVFESEITGSFDLVLCFGFTHTQPPERVGTLFRRLAAFTSDGGGVAIKTFIRGASPATLIFAVQKLVAGNNGDTHSSSTRSGSSMQATTRLG